MSTRYILLYLFIPKLVVGGTRREYDYKLPCTGPGPLHMYVRVCMSAPVSTVSVPFSSPSAADAMKHAMPPPLSKQRPQLYPALRCSWRARIRRRRAVLAGLGCFQSFGSVDGAHWKQFVPCPPSMLMIRLRALPCADRAHSTHTRLRTPASPLLTCDSGVQKESLSRGIRALSAPGASQEQPWDVPLVLPNGPDGNLAKRRGGPLFKPPCPAVVCPRFVRWDGRRLSFCAS